MKPVLPLAIHAGVVLLLARRSGAVPCTPLELDAPIVVDDTAGALQLAAATNCSGGAFNVSWVGSVTVEDTIRVADGTTLSVVGTPDGSSIVSGTGQGSLFEVIGGTLLLSGLSLANGNGASSGGGGIYAVDSVLAIDVCAFEDNVGDFGGGIFLKSSRLDATESTFKRNFAPSSFFASSFSGTSSASLEGAGGAVYAIDSIVTSDNCDFSENGGGAFYMIESVLVSDSCTFSNNFGDDGGGLHLERSVLTASGSNFTGHFANNGGAIYSYMSNATISGNTTWENNNVTDNGGAIGAEENSTLNILGNSLWAGNYAEDSGAGVYVHTSTVDVSGNTVWVDNSVNDSGGAIYAKHSTVNISGSAVWTRNSAAEFGGAVAAEECVLTISGKAEFRDNVITAIGNDDGGGGLGIYQHSTLEISNHVEFVGNLADNGGGLWAEEFVNITISGSATFEGNEAEGEGGGVWLGYGSRMDVLGGGSVHCSRNDAEFGGGIFCDTAVFVVQGDATFFNNSAVAGAGVFLNDGASLSFTGNNVTVAANNASLRGGGVYAEATTQFVIENAAFLSNFARTTGGAMSLLSVGTTSNFRDFDDEAKVVDCRFAGNEAGESGGAMSIAGGSVEIKRADFVDNTAGMQGISHRHDLKESRNWNQVGYSQKEIDEKFAGFWSLFIVQPSR